MQFQFATANLLATASMFVSTEKHRPHITGISIEPHNGGAYVCATDGGMLFAAWESSCSLDQKMTLRVNGKVPAAFARMSASVEIDTDAGTMRAHDQLVAVECDFTNHFPDWRRLVKDIGKKAIEPVRGFNPAFIDKVCAAQRMLGYKGAIGCRQVGEFEPMLFTPTWNTIIIAMPATSKVPVVDVPGWLADPDDVPIAAE